MTDWLHRTNTGRVVYERKPNPWNLRAVLRVLASFIERESYENHQRLMTTLNNFVFSALARRVPGGIWMQRAFNLVVRVVFDVTNWIRKEANLQVGSQLSEIYDRLIETVDWINKNYPQRPAPKPPSEEELF